jgi:hypothetical protein
MLRAVPTRRLLLVLAFLIAVGPACGSSSGGGSAGSDAGGAEAASPDAALADSGADDAVVTEVDSSSPAPEASTPVDSGPSSGDAAAASVCVGVGSPCKDSTTCLCGEPSGCIWDNVACTAGVCTVTQAVPLDAGETCCSSCQAAYDSCTPAGPSCLAQWLACNGTCPGGTWSCPVVCAAGP